MAYRATCALHHARLSRLGIVCVRLCRCFPYRSLPCSKAVSPLILGHKYVVCRPYIRIYDGEIGSGMRRRFQPINVGLHAEWSEQTVSDCAPRTRMSRRGRANLRVISSATRARRCTLCRRWKAARQESCNGVYLDGKLSLRCQNRSHWSLDHNVSIRTGFGDASVLTNKPGSTRMARCAGRCAGLARER